MLHILLVEDDPIDQMAFRRLVRDENLPYEYSIAGSVASAQALLSQEHFEIVLLDYHLQDGTGFDVLAQSVNLCPTIFITGVGDEEIAVKAMKAGAEDYLIKDQKRHYLKMLALTIDQALKRRLAEEAAQKAAADRLRMKVLNSVIEMTAHDMYTPLTDFGLAIHLIRHYAKEILVDAERRQLQTEIISHYIQKLLTKCDHADINQARLNKIISSLLEMMRISILQELPMVFVDLNHLVKQVCLPYQDRTSAKRLTLCLELNTTPLLMQVNPDEFTNLLHQLLDNAIAYTSPGGTIKLRTYTLDAQVCLQVQDTGSGIPTEKLKNIFDHFSRVDDARRTETGGIGLGLAMVKRLVDLHQGQIIVESMVDVGSTFTLVFPKPPGEPRASVD